MSFYFINRFNCFVVFSLCDFNLLVVVESQTGSRLSHRSVLPVDVGALEKLDGAWDVGEEGFVSARFQYQHSPVGYLRKPVGHNSTSRTGTDDDEIVFRLEHLRTVDDQNNSRREHNRPNSNTEHRE